MTDPRFLSQIGKRIRELRLKRKLTQQALATRCSFQKASLSRIEAGKTNMTLLTMRKICLALKSEPAELLRD